MKRSLAIVATALFIVSTASATTIVTPDELAQGLNATQAEVIQESYNDEVEEVPFFVKQIVGDQRINLEYEDRDYRIRMVRAEISTLENGEWDSPSLEVQAEPEDLEEMMNSEEPWDELRQKLNDGEIEYEERGFVNNLKFSVAELFL